MIFITTKEACEILNNEICPTALQAWIRQGNCPLGVYIKKSGTRRGNYKCFKDVVETVAKEGFMKLQERMMLCD